MDIPSANNATAVWKILDDIDNLLMLAVTPEDVQNIEDFLIMELCGKATQARKRIKRTAQHLDNVD